MDQHLYTSEQLNHFRDPLLGVPAEEYLRGGIIIDVTAQRTLPQSRFACQLPQGGSLLV